MTKRDRARYRAIVNQLSELSRNGWDRITHADYAPLERELRVLDAKYDLAVERQNRRRNADRIDGYDRDDLGLSPDY